MVKRLSIDEWALMLAEVTALRSTCARRQVGCVLVDSSGRVLSTGYNGVARGVPHCNERTQNGFLHACSGANAASGEDLDNCRAIHAEQNALLQCKDVDKIYACYVTTSPCVTCAKLLLNTTCQKIIFSERYAHDGEARKLWEEAARGRWADFKSVK